MTTADFYARRSVGTGRISVRDVDRAYAAAIARADLLELRLHTLDAHIREARALARRNGLGADAAI